MQMKKAIFIDRDGTINKLMPKYPNEGVGDIRNYVTKWEDFEFLPGAVDAFGLIEESEYMQIVVSNQGGAIGRKLVDYKTIDGIFKEMSMNLPWVTRYYFCPHLISDNCACIKPKPGMLYQAAIEHNIDLSQSWMIGDSWSDWQAGSSAKVRGLIGIGEKYHDTNAFCVEYKPSLLDAVKFIIGQD